MGACGLLSLLLRLLQSGSDGKTGDAAAKSTKADSSCLQIVLELIQQEKQVQDALRLYRFVHTHIHIGKC